MSTFKSFAAVILVALALTSCSSKSKLLTNTWKIDDIKLAKPVPEQMKGYFDAMLQHTKDYVRITYKADGTFDYVEGEKVQHGTWKLSKDEKQMISTADKGKPVTFNIIELSKDKFVTFPADQNDTITYYMSPSNGVPAKTGPPAPPVTQEAAPNEAPASSEAAPEEAPAKK